MWTSEEEKQAQRGASGSGCERARSSVRRSTFSRPAISVRAADSKPEVVQRRPAIAPCPITGSRRLCALVLLLTAVLLLVTVPVVASTSGDSPEGLATAISPCAQLAVPLESAASYAVLGGSDVKSSGLTIVDGNLGLSPGASLTGFPPGNITGTVNADNAAAAAVQADLSAAYNSTVARYFVNVAAPTCWDLLGSDIGGRTLNAGAYWAWEANLTLSSEPVILDGGGDPNATFVFYVSAGLNVTSSVVLENGTRANDVYWLVGGDVNIGPSANMQGTIMSRSSVTMQSGSMLEGRALAEKWGVSLTNATVVVPKISPPYTVAFTETGLQFYHVAGSQYGTQWYVNVSSGGSYQQSAVSPTTNLAFPEGNGTYNYTVSSTNGHYSPAPALGSFTVNGGDVARAVTFYYGSYPLTFSESGLMTDTNWSVTLRGLSASSTASTVGFSIPNGTYSYSVVAIGYTASPASGNITVNGTAVTRGVAFKADPKTFGVTFREFGLPLGTEWSVTLNGVVVRSPTTTIAFRTVDGTYPYSVAPVAYFVLHPSAGRLVVSGAAAGRAITFGYPNGVPCGPVTVPLGSAASYGELAGTGVRGTGPIHGEIGVYPGASNFDNASAAAAQANLSIAYNSTLARYFEQGKCVTDISGDLGGLTLLPGLYKARSLTIDTAPLLLNAEGDPNATFVFYLGHNLSVASPGGVVLENDAQSGNVYWLVGGHAQIEAVGGAAPMDGTIMALGTSGLVNGGAYIYGRLLVETGLAFVADQAHIFGSAPRVPTVPLYPVKVTESGLPSGAKWGVYVNPGPATPSSSTALSFPEPNGTYGYSPTTAYPGYAPATASHTFTVDGATTTFAVQFTLITKGVRDLTPIRAISAVNWRLIAGIALAGALVTGVLVLPGRPPEPEGTESQPTRSQSGRRSRRIYRTEVQRVNDESGAERVIVPPGVATMLGIERDDDLVWTIDPATRRVRVTVEKRRR